MCSFVAKKYVVEEKLKGLDYLQCWKGKFSIQLDLVQLVNFLFIFIYFFWGIKIMWNMEAKNLKHTKTEGMKLAKIVFLKPLVMDYCYASRSVSATCWCNDI